MGLIPDDYYSVLAGIESSNNPRAKASTSTASGLYQFTKSTWEGLGYAWKDVFNVGLQQKAIQVFTGKNAAQLNAKGIEINKSTLYAAHFLGVGSAIKVLGANEGTPIGDILPAKVLQANQFLKGMTVGDFKNWLAGKTGDAAPSSGSGGGSSDASGEHIGGALNPLNWLDWAKELFSFRTAGRVSAVLVGIILVGVALAAFAFAGGNVKETVKGIVT